MYFVYKLRLRQTKRKRWKMCKQYQKGKDIISSNLHEYLTSILHNIQQLLWNSWILFLRFQSIYWILCFTMHRKQWEQHVKCQTIETDPYFRIGRNIKLYNTTTLSVLQFSRLIDILSENFWSWVDKIVLLWGFPILSLQVI